MLLASGELVRLDVAVVGRRIAAVAPDLVSPGEAVVELSGKTLVPGYVEPHSHTLGPLSVAAYCGQALLHGTACVMSDDSFAYSFMPPGRYAAMLDVSKRLPMVLRWSLRLDAPRTIPLTVLAGLIERPDVDQVGELMTRPLLDELPEEIAELLARARSRGLRVEGHSPGASPATLGVAAAAGVTADHESRRGEELIDRLRAGLWAFIRYTDLLPDAPEMVAAMLERGLSLERTAFTTDWSLPPWIARHGLIDAAIRAALAAGMAAQEAYACASWRPASYLSLDAHLGVLAPGRLANVNVLADLGEPLPERVFSIGREVARDGELLVEVPDIDWAGLHAPRWGEWPRAPAPETYRLQRGDPVISLESSAITRLGRGSVPGDPLACVSLDPRSQTFTRAALHGLPASLEGIASTLTSQRLLITAGADPLTMASCVAALLRVGGGIAYQRSGELSCLALPVGGVLTTASFADVLRFWEDAERCLTELGHTLPQPLSSLFYLASASLPGPRFTAGGLIDARSARTIATPQPVRW